MNLEKLVLGVGYVGLFGIIFAESGLLFGFFLPGDSLLVTAGLLANKGYLNIYLLIPICIFGAIIGDSVGYWFGDKAGRRLFEKKETFIFRKKNLIKAEEFYEKYGSKAIVLARFMPVVRTFVPIVAGIAKMKYSRFVFYNIFGGVFWVLTTTMLGYFLGDTVPNIDRYIMAIVLLIIVLSVLPPAIHFWKENNKEIIKKLREIFSSLKS